MKRMLKGALLAACVAGAPGVAWGNDFECAAAIGPILASSTGDPSLGGDGLPVFDGTPTGALRVDAYPALLAVREVLSNVSTAGVSAIGTFSEWLQPSAATPASVRTFGAGFSPGFSLDVGASATRVVTFAVASYEACVAIAAPSAGPTCGGIAEPGFAVAHVHGSAECRVRLVCAPPAQGVLP